MRLTERPADHDVVTAFAVTDYAGLPVFESKRLRDKAARAVSKRKVDAVRSILGRWAKEDYSVSTWASADIDYCGPDLRGGRGIAAMASHWHGWLSTMTDLAIVPQRFLETGHGQVLVLARFSWTGEERGAWVREFPGVCLFQFKNAQVVRLSLFIDKQPLERVG